MPEAALPANPTERVPVAILGVPFDNVTTAEALALIRHMVQTRQPHYGATVGAEFLTQTRDDVELRRILFDAHLVLAEEKSILWAAKLLGNRLPEIVTVENLVPQLLALAEKNGWRVFFLGGGATEIAIAEKIRLKFPKLPIAGTHAPPEKPLLEMDQRGLLRKLREAKPDILLVAFGFSKQEKWINMNCRELGIPFMLGVGEDLNFLSGAGARSKATRRGGNFKFAVLGQWWRLRSKKSPPPGAVVTPVADPFGNQIIRAPGRLEVAGAAAAQTEWLRAVERGHILFDLTDTVFIDSSGIGLLIRLRKRARELGRQFFLIAPRPPVEAALKLMKLDEFFNVQASINGAQILIGSAGDTPVVTSGVAETELHIRWAGEITALNAIELGVHTESEMSQVSPGMSVVIDLARVTFVDSTGIGLMVRFKKNLQRRDIALKFTNVSTSVRNVLRHTQLEEFLLGEK
jgi:exopolysaccharide biosynthesis WecB/TagA/CpsF family protein/anti-anti-sigma factor